MEAAHVLDRRGVEVLDRADGRATVRAGLIDGGRREQVEQAAVGAGEDALAVFFFHDVALGLEHVLIDDQRAQTRGLGEDQPLQVIGRNGLVIGGDVITGEGVVVAAHVLGQTVEGLVRKVLGRLEHQVFEQVSEARTALRIVLGADTVPDLDRDVRGRRIPRRIDVQSIGQRPPGEAQRRHLDSGGRCCCQRGWGALCKSRGCKGGGGDQQDGGGGGCRQTGFHARFHFRDRSGFQT